MPHRRPVMLEPVSRSSLPVLSFSPRLDHASLAGVAATWTIWRPAGGTGLACRAKLTSYGLTHRTGGRYSPAGYVEHAPNPRRCPPGDVGDHPRAARSAIGGPRPEPLTTARPGAV